MCFDADSSPPIPDNGAEVTQRDLTLTAADGNHFAAFEAAGADLGPGVVVLPDIRGLYRFYEELAVRFAQHGYHAVAIDYFGRTAGVGRRDEAFDFMPHVEQTTFEGVRADVAGAVAHLRAGDPDRLVFTVGFCFGGSGSWYQAADPALRLAGTIGFYGHPNRERPGWPTPVIAYVGDMTCPILGLMGGDDPTIPADEVAAFDAALEEAGVEHEILTYPGAPHSFFDRSYTEFAAESADAWARVLGFLAAHS